LGIGGILSLGLHRSSFDAVLDRRGRDKFGLLPKNFADFLVALLPIVAGVVLAVPAQEKPKARNDQRCRTKHGWFLGPQPQPSAPAERRAFAKFRGNAYIPAFQGTLGLLPDQPTMESFAPPANGSMHTMGGR
jgi:hypothetical protein